jgi:hypothetical protein
MMYSVSYPVAYTSAGKVKSDREIICGYVLIKLLYTASFKVRVWGGGGILRASQPGIVGLVCYIVSQYVRFYKHQSTS